MRDGAVNNGLVRYLHVQVDIPTETSIISVRGDVRYWRCEMMGDVGVRQLKSADGRQEMRIEQKFQDLMLCKSMKDGPE